MAKKTQDLKAKKIIDPEAETVATIVANNEVWEIRRDIDLRWKDQAVYAAHISCSFKDLGVRGLVYEHLWSWEWTKNPACQDDEECWFCEQAIPEEVVALVKMHNLGV